MKMLIILLLVGRIHWCDSERGIGYIKHSKGMVFYHYSVVHGKRKKALKRGDWVYFEVNPEKPTVAKKVIKK